MSRFYRIVIILSILTAFLTAISCDKIAEEIDKYDVSVDEVKDVAITEAKAYNAYGDLFFVGLKASEKVIFSNSNLAKTQSENGAYPNWTFWTKDFLNPFAEYYFSVDYGPDNLFDSNDGVWRRGGLTFICNGKWGEEGSTIKVLTKLMDPNGNTIYDYYYINDDMLSGEVKFTSFGDDHFLREITGGKIKDADLDSIATRDSEIYIYWKEGRETTNDDTDDSFEFYGSISGSSFGGIDYTIEIPESSPIIKTADCPFPVKGITTLGIKNLEFDFDYSYEDEQCDRKAKVNFYGSDILIDF